MQITQWQLRFDPDDRGLGDRWFDRPHAQAEDLWQPVRVPDAWNELFGDDSPDIAWYFTRIDTANRPDERLWLDFSAACTKVTAWCDGELIGEHTGNWEPFSFELQIASGHNSPRSIVLRIDRVRPAPPLKVGDRIIEQGHITKGFHDILSRQPAGLWQPVSLRKTGAVAFDPLGLNVLADLRGQFIHVDLQTNALVNDYLADIAVYDKDQNLVTQETIPLNDPTTTTQIPIPSPQPWSPDLPSLYTLRARILLPDGKVSDEARTRFGFRKVETRDRLILLNGKPLHLSAMLDWGHEPMQTAPAPSPAEIRRRFTTLRAMGFNCVCVCLWYPPQVFYDIADETGMLIWQEHPIWKPEMTEANRAQFQQHFERFFRMDRNHPSVIIVSGSCEHDAMDPQLAAWWWDRARELMPDRLLQVQTAFLRLVPPEQTDLYDEHTYENSGRWPEFLADMDHTLADLIPKPYVMGESILYNDWPDVPGMLAAIGDDRPWWASRVLDDAKATEDWITERYGPEKLQQFRRDARHWHLQGRKWQTEIFRQHASHGGLVQNSIRDVAQCPLGFMDDLDRWRLSPTDTRPWLAPNTLLLRTHKHMRCFIGGQPCTLELGVSHFGDQPVGPTVELNLHAPSLGYEWSGTAPSASQSGRVQWAPFDVELPKVDRPTALTLEAHAPGAVSNRWRLWILPQARRIPDGIAAVGGTHGEPHYTFEEASYSSGWGLKVRSWHMAVPDPGALLPTVATFDRVPTDDARIIIANALTPNVMEKLTGGGRVLLLPDRSEQSLPTMIPTLWGQSPFIADRGPLANIDAMFVLDALDRDLHHRWIRSIPTGQLGIADAIDPYIRLLHTHNAIGKIAVADDLFAAHVEQGILLVSTLDPSTAAGSWLLHQSLHWLAEDDPQVNGRLNPAQLAQIVGSLRQPTTPG